MTTSLVADNEQPRAFDLYLMLSATERMGGIVHDDHRWFLARRFAADNFLRKFGDSDPFWLACDTFTDALPKRNALLSSLERDTQRRQSFLADALTGTPV